ncbi:MAG: discoidin domain-containing protein [Paludibacteraceae bacterium]
MKKISFLFALLCASIMSFAVDEVYDVNFALASNGSSATASSGDAALAIDGNEGTRWESAQTDDETWTLDMGQARIFNTIKIQWEGAYASEFTLSTSNDGENWTTLYTETGLSQAGWQKIKVAKTTAQYIRYHGTKRATGYGQSFFEFQVMLPGVSTLTKIELSAPAIAKVGDGVALSAKALDQNNAEMAAEISYEINPATAGAIVDGKYVPAKVGNAKIVAKSGEVKSAEISIFGYEGSNLALSTNLATDNKIVAQSADNPNGSANDAFFAVDGNAGSIWQGSLTNGTADDEASRTFDAWFVVDLGANYTIDLVTINFEGACAQDYHVDFSTDNTTWALGYNYVGTAGINGRTDMLSAAEMDNYQKVRYVRFWSTKAATEWGMKMYEFQVFGREYVASDDTEKPVMGNATLVSKTWNSAIIAVDATDNDEVAKYHVVDLAQSFDARFVATNGQITVTGLNPSTAYDFMIYAVDAAQNESEYAKSVGVTTDAHVSEPQAACAAPTWPAGQVQAIYSPTYNADCNFQDWGSGTAYTSTDYGKKFALAGGGYFGMDGFALNCLLMEKLHADIWIADDATLRIVPICRNAADTGNEPEIGESVTLRGQQWNSIDLTLSEGEFAKVTNWSNVYQVKIDNAANLTIWLGNLYFYRAEPLVDNEAPTNVQASVAGAGYFSATLAVSAEENSGVVNFRVLNGDQEVAKGGGASGQTVHITVPNLKASTEYTFSVVAYDANDNVAEPVNVQVTTLAAPAPAALPTYEAETVKGVYTDNYTNVAMSIQGWNAEPAISAGLLAEKRQALCITPNNTPSSCFGLAFPAMDITAYDALELDIYPMAENAVLDIQVIGVGEASTTFNLTANEWNHISLNIDGNTKTNCEQIGFFNCQNLQGVCFVQNVLFVQKGDTTAIENTEIGPKAIKMIENGQLIIIRDGKRYNVTGVRVK